MSDDAPAGNLRQQQEEPVRGKYWWIRWVILAIVAIVLAIEVALVWDQLAKAWKSLLSAKWWWLVAAVLAAGASMHSFAQIQRTLLKSAGVRVKQWRSEAAYYAANSLSTTLPGGPVLSATFLLRQQRIWGASTLVASWQLVMSGCCRRLDWHCLAWVAHFSWAPRTTRFRCCSPSVVSSRFCCSVRRWPRGRS
ncbi:putative integral membrane protein [Mycobacterium xenopi 3993]|nr:putative integral membrane protein [Mycobacterium xenopi 3993]